MEDIADVAIGQFFFKFVILSYRTALFLSLPTRNLIHICREGEREREEGIEQPVHFVNNPSYNNTYLTLLTQNSKSFP